MEVVAFWAVLLVLIIAVILLGREVSKLRAYREQYDRCFFAMQRRVEEVNAAAVRELQVHKQILANHKGAFESIADKVENIHTELGLGDKESVPEADTD